MLIAGAVLMIAAGLLFAATGNFWLLLVAGIVGVISPSGNEVGPFLPIEQAALSQIVPAGSLATALGALVGGHDARELTVKIQPRTVVGIWCSSK